MGAQHFRAGIFGVKLVHDPRPEQACGAQLGDFHEEIHANGKEKAETAREFVDIHAARNRSAHIFAAIGQSIGQFLHQIGACLLHVIA